MKHTILHADVMAGLASMPDESIQCVITSPPYWGLRDYGTDGQIGIEPSPEEYVARLVEVFQGVRRVLRDDGVMWVVLGDCYAASGKSGGGKQGKRWKEYGAHGENIPARNWSTWGLKAKDLIGMPWRIAFALQADGWYLRSDIIWAKPNPMPESVRDRPTRSHEFVFLFAKSKKYYYDADAVREPAQTAGQTRNRRTVWTITPQPLRDAHFATFPEALVRPCIRAGTSEAGCCPACGTPWRRVVHIERETRDDDGRTHSLAGQRMGKTPVPERGWKTQRSTVGWQPGCQCAIDHTVPCSVLDPFAGSGTVNLVAHDLGRSSVGIELGEKYIDIIKDRWARGGRPAEALEVRAI